MKIHSNSREETAVVAETFLGTLKPSRQATVVALKGDLGAGKTTFAQGLAWALGVEEAVTSPTFVIQKVYKLPPLASFSHFIHIDCYRLESPSELVNLGFNNLLTDPGNLIVIEWPERVKDVLPPVVTVNLRFVDDTTREISYAD